MAKNNRFPDPVDLEAAERARAAGRDSPTGPRGTPGYTADGIKDVLMRSGEAPRPGSDSAPPSRGPQQPDRLTLDYDVVPERIQNRKVAQGMKAGEMGSYVAPRNDVGPRPPRPSAPQGMRRVALPGPPPVRGELRAHTVHKPKRTVLVVGLLLLCATGGGFLFQYLSREGALSDLRGPIEALEGGRAGMYRELAGFVAHGEEAENNYCPQLPGLLDDVTFQFPGTPIQGLPTSTRVERARARYQSVIANDGDTDSLQTEMNQLNHLSTTVVHVRVVDYRRPQLDSHSGRDAPFLSIVPGYIIGDAFVGSTESDQVVCSFRFFAASARSLPRGRNAEADMVADLVNNTNEALTDGAEGIQAVPGTRGGRYVLDHPPVGF